MSCSKLKKAVCLQNADCEWIVGSGCKKAAKSKAENKSKKEWDVIIPLDAKKKVMKEMYYDIQLSKSFIDYVDEYFYNCVKYILRNKKKNFDVADIKAGFKNGASEIVNRFNNEGDKVVKTKNCKFYFDGLQEKIETLFGKTLTKEAVYFLAGGLEYLYAEIADIVRSIAVEKDKKRLTKEHMVEALTKDHDFSIMLKLW